MTREVITVSPSQTLFEALMLTRTAGIRHLPVLAERSLVGLVSDRDLRLAMPAKGAAPEEERDRLLADLTVGEVMTAELVTTTPDVPVEAAAQLLYRHHIGCLPVLEADELVGILTETDVLRAFVELFGTGEPSSRIEIRMPPRPGELARVVRLIGIDYKLNITGLVFPPLAEGDAVAIVHLQTPDPRAVIKALEKMGYQVGWPTLSLTSGGPVSSSHRFTPAVSSGV